MVSESWWRGGIFAIVNLELTEAVKHIGNQMTHWIPATIEMRGMPGDVNTPQ